jgi:multisubunit Na+/H+ antiporter MnhB subunit
MKHARKHEHGGSLRELLPEVEPVDAARRERYEREVHDMIERKLTASSKVLFYAVSVISLLIAGFLAYLALATHKGLPGLATFGLLFGAFSALVWMGFIFSILRKGSWNLKSDPLKVGRLLWVFSVFLVTLFALLADRAPNPVQALLPILIGLLLLITGGLIMTTGFISQTSLEIKERLLRLEQQLAALAEDASKGRE